MPGTTLTFRHALASVSVISLPLVQATSMPCRCPAAVRQGGSGRRPRHSDTLLTFTDQVGDWEAFSFIDQGMRTTRSGPAAVCEVTLARWPVKYRPASTTRRWRPQSATSLSSSLCRCFPGPGSERGRGPEVRCRQRRRSLPGRSVGRRRVHQGLFTQAAGSAEGHGDATIHGLGMSVDKLNGADQLPGLALYPLSVWRRRTLTAPAAA